MTSELLQLQETLHSTGQQQAQHRRCLAESHAKAAQDEKFEHLLSRIEKLRSIARAQGRTKQYKKREQTSFVF